MELNQSSAFGIMSHFICIPNCCMSDKCKWERSNICIDDPIEIFVGHVHTREPSNITIKIKNLYKINFYISC